MRIAEVKKLHPGDEVQWIDPDEGKCSRIYKISTIKVVGNVVVICDVDGSCLECFARELE